MNIYTVEELKEIALMTVMFNYAEISKKFDNIEEPRLERVLNRLLKKEKSIRKRIKISKDRSKIAEQYFDKFKKLDSTVFEGKDFSAFLMTILLLQYFVYESKNLELRNEFFDLPLNKMVEELENSNLRSNVFFHHKVVTRFLEE